MDDNPHQSPESEPLTGDTSGLGDPSGLLDYVLYSVFIGIVLGVSLFVALMVMCGGNLSPP